MRKRIPRLGRWPTNAAEVWKLAAAEYRRVGHRRSRIIEALVHRIQRLEDERDTTAPTAIKRGTPLDALWPRPEPATALEYDDTVERLRALALAHGWVLKSQGLVRYHGPEEM